MLSRCRSNCHVVQPAIYQDEADRRPVGFDGTDRGQSGGDEKYDGEEDQAPQRQSAGSKALDEEPLK